MRGVERATILLKPYARMTYLEEDPDALCCIWTTVPAPLESLYRSRDDVRIMALAMLAVIGEGSNEKSR